MAPPDLSGGPVGNGWLGCGQTEILRQPEFFKTTETAAGTARDYSTMFIAECKRRQQQDTRLTLLSQARGEKKEESEARRSFPSGPARFGRSGLRFPDKMLGSLARIILRLTCSGEQS
jgi:hypothetical protein